LDLSVPGLLERAHLDRLGAREISSRCLPIWPPSSRNGALLAVTAAAVRYAMGTDEPREMME
jgi:hypothetical protein